MIDSTIEKLIPLTDAAKRLPRRRQGKRPHRSTLHRWAKKGLRGVKLEVLRVGATLCTTEAALNRFFVRLTQIDEALVGPSQQDQRATDNSTIEKELDEAGL